MSLIHLGSYPIELQYFLLDRMDEKSLVALKHIDRASRDSFESGEIVHYLLSCRLQRTIDRAKPFAWRSPEHYAVVRQFFQVVSILPAQIKFPQPCNYDKSSELKSLISHLTEVISTGPMRLADPLTDRCTYELVKLQDERIAGFMTLLPIRILQHTKQSWAELSRRFALYGHLDEEAFFSSFCIGLGYINITSGRDFIQGVSKNLLISMLNRYVSLIGINYHMIWGFTEIENPVEAHEKVIVFGNWFQNYAAYSLENAENRDAHSLEEFNRARTLMNILFMATFADKKMPLDRKLVQSWIPKSFECWEKFSVLAKDWNVYPERNAAVKQHFGELFRQ